MPKTIPIQEAERNLRQILASLSGGERVTLIDEEGQPLGEVSAPTGQGDSISASEKALLGRWDSLARRIGDAWDEERSAVEQLQRDRSRLNPELRDDQ